MLFEGEQESKKVKTGEEGGGGAAAAEDEEYDDELEDAKHVQLFNQVSFLPPEIQLNILKALGLSIQEIINYKQWLIRNEFEDVADVAEQLALEDVKDLKKIARTIVSRTPRERFDALCAHMKKGKNRNPSVKGTPLRNPETTYRCEACLHVYDPATDSDPVHPVMDFNALPDTWVCASPSCKEPKSTYKNGQIRHVKLHRGQPEKDVGLRVEQSGDYLEIKNVIPDSSAYHVGFERGDVFLAVDSKTLFRATEEKLNEMMPQGATVVFDVASYAGDQYKWKSSMGAAELWAAPIVEGLIDQDRGGIDLEDVCKLLDSALPSCNAGTLSKGDMFGGYWKHYVYNIEFPEKKTLIVAIMINETECKVLFQVSIYYVEYKCFVDEAVTDFAEVLLSLVRTNPENDTLTVTFWDAFITFSNKCTLLSPDEREGRQMVRLFRFMLKLLVYFQNYPFFSGEEKGHNAPFERVFFCASFVDKCLAL